MKYRCKIDYRSILTSKNMISIILLLIALFPRSAYGLTAFTDT
jgi:hypothetical protein